MFKLDLRGVAVKMLRIMIIVACGLTACTVSEVPRPEGTQVSSLDSGGAQCEVKDISACTSSAGGLSCFTRCGFQPSDKFCKMESLSTCLNSAGGNGCYKNHCGADAHSGAFVPARGSKLETLMSSGRDNAASALECCCGASSSADSSSGPAGRPSEAIAAAPRATNSDESRETWVL